MRFAVPDLTGFCRRAALLVALTAFCALLPGGSAPAQEACFEPVPGRGPCRQAATRHWNAMTGPFENCGERDTVNSACRWCIRQYSLAIRQCSLKLSQIPVEVPVDDCATKDARVQAAVCVIGGGFTDICGARYKMNVRDCRAAAEPAATEE